jgi:hypothetical protein
LIGELKSQYVVTSANLKQDITSSAAHLDKARDRGRIDSFSSKHDLLISEQLYQQLKLKSQVKTIK